MQVVYLFIYMSKSKFKPVYKKLVNLKENVENRSKLLKFKKKKWKQLINIYKKKLNLYRKVKPKDQTLYLVTKYPNVNFIYKKIYKNTMNDIRKFKLINGGLINKSITNILFTKFNKLMSRLSFLKFFECRLDITLFRCKFAANIRFIRQLILHGRIFVNNKKTTIKSFILKPGDIIKIKLKCYKSLKNNVLKAIWPIYPKHLVVNYKIMQIVFNILNNNLYLNFFYYINLERIVLSKFVQK